MKILYVEDNGVDAYAFVRQLPGHEIHWAEHKTFAFKLLKMHKFDLVVSDYLGVDVFASRPDFEYLNKHNFLLTSSSVFPQLEKYRDKFVLKSKLIEKVKELIKEFEEK